MKKQKMSPNPSLTTHGNNCFRDKNYKQALKYYKLALNKIDRTTSLDSSNMSNTSSLSKKSALTNQEKAKLYQNMSAVYKRLKKYPECLENAIYALEIDSGYEKAWKVVQEILKMKNTSTNNDNEDIDQQLSIKFSKFELLVNIMACVIYFKLNDSELKKKANQYLNKLCLDTSEIIYKDKIINRLPSFKFITNHLSLFEDFSNCLFYKILKSHGDDYEYFEKLFEQFVVVDKNGVVEENKKVNNQLSDDLENSPNTKLLIQGTLAILSSNFKTAVNMFETYLKDQASGDASGDARNETESSQIIYANIQLAISYSHLKELQKANSYYKKAISLNPNCSAAYYQRAQLNLSLNEYQNSLNDFSQAFSIEVENAKKRNAAETENSDTQYSKTAGRAAAYKNYLYWQSAFISDDTDKVNEALNNFKLDLEKFNFQNSSEYLGLYAQAAQSTKSENNTNNKLAHKLYDQCYQADTSICTALVHKANLLHTSGDSLEAINILVDVVNNIDSKNEFAYESIATIYKAAENFPEAIKYYEKAIECSKSKGEVFEYSEEVFRLKAFIEIKRKFGLEMP